MDCAVLVRVGPPVVTYAERVEALAARGLSPFPPGAWFTVAALAMMFGVKLSHMRMILTRHKHNLQQPPVYRLRRRRAPTRILSEQDFDYLRTLFPVRIGKKAKP